MLFVQNSAINIHFIGAFKETVLILEARISLTLGYACYDVLAEQSGSKAVLLEIIRLV